MNEKDCHTKPPADWHAQLPQAILAALEYRGFYDAGKYLDDTILEHVAPIVEKELLAQRSAIVEEAIRKVEHYYGKDPLCDADLMSLICSLQDLKSKSV